MKRGDFSRYTHTEILQFTPRRIRLLTGSGVADEALGAESTVGRAGAFRALVAEAAVELLAEQARRPVRVVRAGRLAGSRLGRRGRHPEVPTGGRAPRPPASGGEGSATGDAERRVRRGQ